MRIFILCLLTVITLSISSAFAGGNHSHGPFEPIKKEQALTFASDIVAAIAIKGELDASWAKVKPTEAINKNLPGPKWVISFNNPKINDQEKQTLYVFLTLDGQYLGVNFSGS